VPGATFSARYAITGLVGLVGLVGPVVPVVPWGAGAGRPEAVTPVKDT
jgi:hypothetical protein